MRVPEPRVDAEFFLVFVVKGPSDARRQTPMASRSTTWPLGMKLVKAARGTIHYSIGDFQVVVYCRRRREAPSFVSRQIKEAWVRIKTMVGALFREILKPSTRDETGHGRRKQPEPYDNIEAWSFAAFRQPRPS